MVASPPDRALRRITALTGLLIATGGAALHAQVEARPVLQGTAWVADTLAVDGVVVLHRVADGSPGTVDSMNVASGGVFRFDLPTVPDPARSDMYFATMSRDGVVYFGPVVTRAVELDSLYEIRAYDTLLAPSEGATISLQSRSLFLEPEEDGTWRATDIFELRNERLGTWVARDGGRTWSYPLPSSARDVSVGEAEMSPDAVEHVGEELVVRAALPPGERLFVVRYVLDSPFVTFPTPGTSEVLDLLVAQRGPEMEIEGLELLGLIELDESSVFRRYSATDFAQPSIRPIEVVRQEPPPVEWIAVILAMVLTVAGLVAFRARPAAVAGRGGAPPDVSPRGAVGSDPGREALLMEVAELDEAFASKEAPSEAERAKYERRRATLLERVRSRT